MLLLLKRKVLPAVKKWKDLEKLLQAEYDHLVLLDCHINQLEDIVRMVKAAQKQILVHADLIHGLNKDDHAAEFLCQKIKPTGLISTRANMILKAKQNNILAVQRLFLIDTGALEKSYALLKKTVPDFVEVLPGIMPPIIAEVAAQTGIPVLAGGLIRTVDDVENAIAAGAQGVTTSRHDLWEHYA